MGRGRGGGNAAVLAGALSLVVVVLLVVASSGPVRVWSDPPPGDRTTLTDGFGPADDGLSVGQGERPLPQPGADGDGWLLRTLAVALGVMLLRWAWIVVRFWATVLRRRREKVVAPAGGFAVLPGAVTDETPHLELDIEAQLGALATGDARNAIVACWMQLEHDVAAAGLPRSPAETSAEFTERVLARAVVDTAAVVDLAERYREARFSQHDLVDADRDRAVDALRRIHASLKIRTSHTESIPSARTPA
ncbi:MAG: DUF4129 domain-containing protein [Actinobacteria bacterium]|nr:DUF4129 domain-containing protein [Actinomycetota bacterium]